LAFQEVVRLSGAPSGLTCPCRWTGKTHLSPCAGTTCWTREHNAAPLCCPRPLGSTEGTATSSSTSLPGRGSADRMWCGRATHMDSSCLPSHSKDPGRRLLTWAWPGGRPAPLAYPDDSFLQGAPASTMRAFATITTLSAPLGLRTQPAKCAVHSGDHAAATAIVDQRGVRHAPKGLLSAGTRIGTPAFQTANAKGCAKRACHLMDELLTLLLGNQDRWLLLHGSLHERVAHLSWAAHGRTLARRWCATRAKR
jgi:hypothetical protein